MTRHAHSRHSMTGKGPYQKASSVAGGLQSPKTSFDPRALLDPKRFAKRPASEDSAARPINSQTQSTMGGTNGTRTLPWMTPPSSKDKTMESVGQEMPGMGGLIERLHGVSSREGPPSKRQKLKRREDQNGPVEEKASAFTGGGKGGVIGEYMKQKKEEATQEAAAMGTVVDLTGGEDDDDDVVVVSDSSLKEVCYGCINGYVQAHAIPSPSPTAYAMGPDWWPVIKVELQRGVSNTHIISAIDPLGNDFGTVASGIAIGLAPLMDTAQIGVRVQARLLTRRRTPDEVIGQRTSKYYELTINLYGQRRYGKNVGQFLTQKQIRLRSPMVVDAGIETENPHAGALALGRPAARPGTPGAAPTSTYLTRTVEAIRQEVLGMFDSLQKSEHVPQMEPDPRIVTPLLPHQKQALHFMTDKEKERVFGEGEAANGSLWRQQVRNNGQKSYYNVITGKEERSKPPEVLGGILADMMGLGKTLSILSLIVSTMDASVAWSKKKPPGPKSAESLPLLRNSKTTLLVSPLSTITNWEDQIISHVKAETLSYYIYHGTNRCRDITQLGRHDIVITTYAVVASEFDKRSKKMKDGAVSPLQQTNWFRIVLDEAHMIREQATRQSRAICALSAQRRWAVTGTPVQNRLDDLGALIKFLRISPFDEKGGFAQYILSPFKNADPDILPKLRLLVDSITLRRLKDRIELPPRQDRIVRLQFDKQEKALYDLFAKDSANKMRIVASEQQSNLAGKAYVHVLRAILRLRLICAHGKELLGDEDMKMVEGASINHAIDLDDDEDEGKPALSGRQAYDMFNLMKETNADQCNQCGRQMGAGGGGDDTFEDAQDVKDDVIGYMAPCFQLLCKDCIKSYREALQTRASDAEHATCPLCNTYIRSTVFQLLQSKVEEDEDRRMLSRDKAKSGKRVGRYGGPHAKTRALLESLHESRLESEAHPEERPIKSVVFSGWTTHLDLIQIALEDHNIPFVRLDGKMSRTRRGASLDTFRDDPQVTVMLVSIMAGGLGLNLTTASKVYVMEPQFNPAAEAQAIDRIHRLGQTREVTTTRFIMADSFEEKMLELQRKKQNLADLSMNRNSSGKPDKNEAMKRRLEELRSLFK